MSHIFQGDFQSDLVTFISVSFCLDFSIPTADTGSSGYFRFVPWELRQRLFWQGWTGGLFPKKPATTPPALLVPSQCPCRLFPSEGGVCFPLLPEGWPWDLLWPTEWSRKQHRSLCDFWASKGPAASDFALTTQELTEMSEWWENDGQKEVTWPRNKSPPRPQTRAQGCPGSSSPSSATPLASYRAACLSSQPTEFKN